MITFDIEVLENLAPFCRCNQTNTVLPSNCGKLLCWIWVIGWIPEEFLLGQMQKPKEAPVVGLLGLHSWRWPLAGHCLIRLIVHLAGARLIRGTCRVAHIAWMMWSELVELVDDDGADIDNSHLIWWLNSLNFIALILIAITCYDAFVCGTSLVGEEVFSGSSSGSAVSSPFGVVTSGSSMGWPWATSFFTSKSTPSCAKEKNGQRPATDSGNTQTKLEVWIMDIRVASMIWL